MKRKIIENTAAACSGFSALGIEAKNHNFLNSDKNNHVKKLVNKIKLKKVLTKLKKV